MNAAKSINDLIALQRIQQALDLNRNDVGAILELAVYQEKPENKRKLLERVLALEPGNQAARDMLLDLDRAGLAGTAVSSFAPAAASTVDSPPGAFVSRYSLIHQFLVYPCVLLAGLVTALAFPDWQAMVFFGGILLLLVIPLWFVSAVVRLNGTSIELTRLYGVYRREVQWMDIRSVQPNPMGVGMKIVAEDGTSMRLSSQLGGYPAIVQALTAIRPDLFKLDGAKTFRKGFVSKYGLLIAALILTPMTIGSVFVPPFLPGLLIAAAVFYMWRTALNSPHTLSVDGGTLYIRSFRRNQELAPGQISEIDMITTYNRRGVARTHGRIQVGGGKVILLTGFPEGNEILCGSLKSWWAGQRSR